MTSKVALNACLGSNLGDRWSFRFNGLDGKRYETWLGKTPQEKMPSHEKIKSAARHAQKLVAVAQQLQGGDHFVDLSANRENGVVLNGSKIDPRGVRVDGGMKKPVSASYVIASQANALFKYVSRDTLLPVPEQRPWVTEQRLARDVTTNVAGTGGAACCAWISLDEPQHAISRTDRENMDMGHSEYHIPKTAGDAFLNIFIGYLAFGSVKIGYEIFKWHKDLAVRLQRGCDAIHKTPESERTPTQKAELLFLQRQQREARFQQWVAGVVSTLGSIFAYVGLWVMKISPVGLSLLLLYGVGHAINSVVHFVRDTMALRKLRKTQPAMLEAHKQLEKRKWVFGRNIGVWLLYSGGIAVLGALSLGAFGVMAATGALPGLLTIVGISILVTGIVGAVVNNNLATSKRFYAGAAPARFWDKISGKKEEEVDARLKELVADKKTANAYRKHFLENLDAGHGHRMERLQWQTLRILNKIGFYATMGLVPGPFMRNKLRLKRMAISHYKGDGEARIQALRKLDRDVANAPIQAGKSLAGTLQAIQRSGRSGEIMKLFAQRVLVPAKGLKDAPAKPWLLGEYESFAVRPEFYTVSSAACFTNNSVQQKILGEDLNEMVRLKPCCDGSFFAGELIEKLGDKAFVPAYAEKALRAVLHQCIDQFLVYQLPKDIQAERNVWVEYVSGLKSS